MEQRYVIKFLQLDGYTPYQIIEKLEEISKDKALRFAQVYYWLAELRRGRIDINDEPETGCLPNDDLDNRFFACIQINPHCSCRCIAALIGSSGCTVFRYLSFMGYKNMLHRWGPHSLNDVLKKSRFSMAKIILKKSSNLTA